MTFCKVYDGRTENDALFLCKLLRVANSLLDVFHRILRAEKLARKLLV